MNEDDLLKCGRADALPNDSDAGLVSHVKVGMRHQCSNSDLLLSWKWEESPFHVYGIPLGIPLPDEETDEDESDLTSYGLPEVGQHTQT